MTDLRKKALTLLLSLLLCLPAIAGSKRHPAATRLVGQLQEMQTREEVTPDEFYADVDTLRQLIQNETDPTAKAVYSAALAHLVTINSFRAQTEHLDTPSHPDSLKEWSCQEYYDYAARLYRDALSQPSLLHSQTTVAWRPVPRQGKDEKVYASDMLYVVWRAMLQDIPEETRKKHDMPGWADMISFYRSCRLDEAALWLAIDSMDARPTMRETDREKEKWLQIRNDYAHLQACAEIYLRISRLPGLEQKEKKEWLEQGLQSYPKSTRRNALRNALLDMQQPTLNWFYRSCYAPHTEVKWKLKGQNVKTATFTLYALPYGFSETQEDMVKAVRREGKKISTFTHHFNSAQASDPYSSFTDSVSWTTPGYGIYAMVADGKSGAKLSDKTSKTVCLFRVSSLAFFSLRMPAGRLRLVAVDATTGEPRSGVNVELSCKRDRNITTLHTYTTSDQGYAEVDTPDQQRMPTHVRMWQGADSATTASPLYYYPAREMRTSDFSQNTVRLYTDRSVYRPGQQVYVAALAFLTTANGSQVESGRKLQLAYYDANSQELATHEVVTDSLGVAADSIQLPASVLPGGFNVRLKGGSSSAHFRVEEYKRATFYVNIDKTEPTSWPTKNIPLRGQARTYSGMALTDARVTVRYRWQEGWPYRSHRAGDHEWKEADTVQTDSEGRFMLRLPVPKATDSPHKESHLQAEVDVLSRQGETVTASHSISVSHTALRMSLQTEPFQEKAHMKPWNIQLFDCVGQPVASQVRCQLLKDGKEVFSTTVDAGKPTLPEGLQEVPSGRYTLYAFARVNADTASVRVPFTLFSLYDRTALPDTPLQLYTPETTFSEDHPATLRVASSLNNAYIFCTAANEEKLVMDTLIHLHNEARLLEIPYQPHYGESIRIVCHLMENGQLQTGTVTLRKGKPQQTLTLRWDTFRNKLEPGQQEEWRMTLCKPDGTPAQANVMCTLYDAALDAIQPHRFGLTLPQRAIPITLYANQHSFQLRHGAIPFNLQLYTDRYPQWSSLNEELFFHQQKDQGIIRPFMRLGSHHLMERVVTNTAPQMMAKASTTADGNMAMDTKAVVEEEMADEADITGSMPETPTGMVRTGLHELAFFKPMLRTDANGQVALSFTLPEGLTSWHLMGLAHTADLYATTFEDTIVASKRIMAQLQLPRFLRNGDKAMLTASVANCTASPVKGNGLLQICDATNSKVLHSVHTSIRLEGGQDTVFHFPYNASADHTMLVVRWVANTPEVSDGEQRAIPVLDDVQEVIETKSFRIMGAQHWQMDLKKLFAYDHPEATGRKLTLEYTARPVWMAIRALPTLYKPRANDVLSLTAAYYADAMACYTLRNIPQLKEAVEQWSKNSHQAGGTLRMNEELTGMEVSQTPWLKDAQRDSLQRQALTELYQSASQPQTRLAAIEAIARLQLPDGSFSWYPGMMGNAYLTAEVARMLTRLHVLTGTDTDNAVNDREAQVYDYAMEFLSRHVADWLKQSNANGKIAVVPSSTVVLQYLYALSRGGWQPDANGRKAVRECVGRLKETATDLPYEQRAMAAIVLHLQGEKSAARQLTDKLRTLVMQADGFHLAYPGGRGVSIDRKIQQHVALMEAFSLIMPKDSALNQGMEEWLMLQKRTQAWEQPVQTADAVYMIMQHHAVPFAEKENDQLTIRGSKGSQPVESSTDYPGYFRTSIGIAQPRKLEVDKRSEGTSWGAVYAQYSIPYASLQAQREGITVRRDVAQASWQEGDRVHIRYTLTVDHDLEYVALHAGRIAAAQPAVQFSGYCTVSGLGCYRAVHDTGNSYYFDSLPRGTYVIEEDWTLDRPGTYQLGAARVQCMYAPEFQAHTAGESIMVRQH